MLSIPNVVPRIKGEKLRKICEQYINGEIYIQKRYPLITVIEGSIIWFEDPLEDRSWRFWLHSLIMVEHLINGYEEFGDERYLDKAKDFILDWYRHNGSSSKSEMAWHDHSTALRLIQICRYYLKWKERNDADAETNNVLVRLIETHSEKLADPDFYMPKHNHGLDQDLALLTATLALANKKKSTQWKGLALSRLEAQIHDLFAEDGSYLEHSPHYCYLLLDRIVQFAAIIEYVDIDYYQKIMVLIRKSLHFLISILQPDGLIPTIGDSEARHVLFSSNESLELSLQEFIDNINNADQITLYKFQSDDQVFPQGGYAILKNKADTLEKLVQITFCCSFHSRVHKHHDDLSFILYSSGLPIFMDSGKYNYNYKSAERQYVVSSRAHNSVIVDDEDTEIIRLNIGKSALTSFYASEDFSFCAGCHCLYPGVIHSRLIVYIKPYHILIFDYLEGYKNHKFDQNFLVNGNIDVEEHNNTFTGKFNNKILFTMTPIHHSNLVNHVAKKGAEDPLDGWISTDYSVLTPATAIRFSNKGKDTRMATHIKLGDFSCDNTVNNFSWNQEHISFEHNGRIYEFIMLHNKTYAILNSKKLNVQHYHKDTLVDAIRDARQYEYRQKYRSERQRRLRFSEMLNKLNQIEN